MNMYMYSKYMYEIYVSNTLYVYAYIYIYYICKHIYTHLPNYFNQKDIRIQTNLEMVWVEGKNHVPSRRFASGWYSAHWFQDLESSSPKD